MAGEGWHFAPESRLMERGQSRVRTAMISGLVLVAAGLLLVFKGVNYTQEQSVLKIGEFEAKMQQQRRVPEWIGGVALGAGLVLVVVAISRRGK